MRRKFVASSILFLTPLAAFAPAAMGQRTAGNGYAPSSGAVAAAPRTSAQGVAAPVHALAVHTPAASGNAAGANTPTRASVRVAHAPGATSSATGFAAGSAGTRAGGAAIGVHRVAPAGVQPRRLNVTAGLGHLPLSSTDFSSSPGLGFDYSHFAAVNGGSGIDDRRMRDRVNAGVPFGFGGFLLSPEVIVVEGQQGEASAGAEENAEPNAGNGGGAENGAMERENLQDQFAPASLGPAAPIREAAEYVFVRRDGSLVFAVAYTWDHGTLRYVTRDGLRRSIASDALDIDATQQFNEQRGLNFKTPA
jgi:hypothetical protein